MGQIRTSTELTNASQINELVILQSMLLVCLIIINCLSFALWPIKNEKLNQKAPSRGLLQFLIFKSILGKKDRLARKTVVRSIIWQIFLIN